MTRTAEDYPIVAGDPLAAKAGCLVLPVFASRRLDRTGRALNEASDGRLMSQLERVGMRGRRGESRLLLDVHEDGADRVLAIGCGERHGIDARRFRAIAEHAASALGSVGGGKVTSCLALVRVRGRDRYWRVRQLIEAIERSRYRYDATGSLSESGGAVKSVTHLVAKKSSLDAARQARDEALATAAGVALARDLGNRPPGVCTPTHLADEACRLAARYAPIDTEILDEEAMLTQGMGAMLAVSRGSAEPAAFVVARYCPTGTTGAPIVLIGKGVTFDSGGLSLKQPIGMQHMKLDMAGAGAVLGALEAIARLALPLHVVVIVAAVENMPGSRATRPGDVVTTLSGSRVEILNTDAEGRLVLADALTWAARLKPAAVIDVATLTGSAKAALGRPVHALFSSSESLSGELIAAGSAAHDRAWRMPLMEEYRAVLESKVADLANVGGRSAGASVAACFLWRFAKGLRWAHLDVAGTASSDGDATGRPVGLLVRFLIARAARSKRAAAPSN